MSNENEQNNSEEFSLLRMQKVIILMILFSPVMYIFILLILQTKLQPSHQYTTIFSTNLGIIAIFFVFLSVVCILLSHLLFIPYINKIKVKDPRRVFWLYVNLINFGGSLISLFGLYLGILEYSEYRFIDWVVVLLFIAVGAISTFYLYYTEFKPWARLLEQLN